MAEKIAEIGEYYPGETIAEELVYFNRFVKRGTDLYDIKMCDAGENCIGAVEFDYRAKFKDDSARTGWKQGEELPVKGNGWAWIVSGEALTKGDKVKAGTDGVAMKYTALDAAGSYSESGIQAIADQEDIRLGEVLIGTTTPGNLVKIQLKGWI